jgi:hypothetical protein
MYIKNKNTMISSQIVSMDETASKFVAEFSKYLSDEFRSRRARKALAKCSTIAFVQRLWQFLGDLILRQNFMGTLDEIFTTEEKSMAPNVSCGAMWCNVVQLCTNCQSERVFELPSKST